MEHCVTLLNSSFRTGQERLPEKDAQELIGLKETDLACTSHEISTDSQAGSDIICTAGSEEMYPEQGSTCQQWSERKQPEVNKVPIEALKTSEDLQRLAMQEIESLCTPCNVEFECSVLLSIAEKPHGQRHKRPKLSTETAMPESISLSLEFIQGDNKDLLHQISQYLKNKILQHKF